MTVCKFILFATGSNLFEFGSGVTAGEKKERYRDSV